MEVFYDTQCCLTFGENVFYLQALQEFDATSSILDISILNINK